MDRACDPVWRSLAPLTVVQPGRVLALPLTALLDAHTHRTRQSRTATAAILACTTGVVLFMARAAATIATQQLGTRTELAQIVTLLVGVVAGLAILFAAFPDDASWHRVRSHGPGRAGDRVAEQLAAQWEEVRPGRWWPGSRPAPARSTRRRHSRPSGQTGEQQPSGSPHQGRSSGSP